MNKTIFASFYSRQEAENAINNLKNEILSADNPVIIRDNNQYNASPQNNVQDNVQDCPQNTLENNQQTNNQMGPSQPLTQTSQGVNTNCLPPQMPYYNANNFNGFAQQNLYNGYTSGSTIGGLFGLATSAISMATIGAPYILTTTLANMFSPMTKNQPVLANSTSNYYCGCPPTSDQSSQHQQQPQQQNNGVQVTLNIPEEKIWDVTNSLKNSNAVDVRSC